MSVYQQYEQYPDPTGSGQPGGYGAMPSAGPQPKEWRFGYMADAKLASWPSRLASGAIDYLSLALILQLFGAMHVIALGWFLSIALFLLNSVYMQGTTGQSLGKRVMGSRLVSAVETGPWEFTFVYPGPARTFGRELAHIVDAIPFYLGFVRPLWQRQHKTCADSMAKTVVLARQSASEYEVKAREPGQITTRNL